MISLAPEVERARADGVLDDATAARLTAREERLVFSLWRELRFLTWAGVMLIVAGVGVLVRRHIDDIGPLAIAIGIGLAAAGCYAWAWRKRDRQESLVDDFVLLLGALLISADLGYVESQFHLLDAGWPRHFLILTVLHGLAAYYFRSRLVLSLALGALAAWLGVEQQNVELLWDATPELALRMLAAAAAILVWREIDRRADDHSTFTPVFEHFAANLAGGAGIVLAADADFRWFGVLVALAAAAVCAWHGRRSERVSFVLYAYVYAVIAIDIAVCDFLDREETLIALYLVISTIAAIAGLFVTYARFRKRGD